VADAAVSSSRSVAVMLENSSIRECEVVRDAGIGVRAFVKGGVRQRHHHRADARSRAHSRRPGRGNGPRHDVRRDPEFVALPDPSAWTPIAGLWDDRVAGLAAGDVVAWCQQGIEEARAVSAEAILSGGADLAVGEVAWPARREWPRDRGTHLGIGYMAVVAHGDDIGAYFEQDTARAA